MFVKSKATFTCFTISMAGFLLSCEGKVVTVDGASSPVGGDGPKHGSINRYSSTEAVVDARASNGLPSDTVLAAVASVSQVDASGEAEQWRVTLVDPETRNAYKVTIPGVGSPPSLFESGYECSQPAVADIPSTVIVPKALALFRKRGIETDSAIVHFRETGICLAMTTPGVSVVSVRPESGVDWWSAYFGTDGEFVRVCGPCEVLADVSCGSCTNVE